MKPKITTFYVLALLLITFLLISPRSNCQSWETVQVGTGSATISLPYTPDWELSYADDSSMVWVGEASDNDINYGIIYAEYSNIIYDASIEDLTTLGKNYLDFLRREFKIVSHTGYDSEQDTDYEDYTVTITDSWVDSEGDSWIIKTWVDSYGLAVLYIYSNPESLSSAYKDYYFNSFSLIEDEGY
jgi:hypothetical protein